MCPPPFPGCRHRSPCRSRRDPAAAVPPLRPRPPLLRCKTSSWRSHLHASRRGGHGGARRGNSNPPRVPQPRPPPPQPSGETWWPSIEGDPSGRNPHPPEGHAGSAGGGRGDPRGRSAGCRAGGAPYLSARLQKSRMAGIAAPGPGEAPSFAQAARGERVASGQGSATRAGWQPQGSSQRCHEYTQ